jgi:D-alanine-D-alanine ligase
MTGTGRSIVNDQRKIRVAVIFGGRGPEHAVSCMGGGNMLGSIDRDKYEVVPVGITPDGSWVLAADEPARLTATAGELPSVAAVAQPGTQVVPWAGGPAQAVTPSAPGQPLTPSAPGQALTPSAPGQALTPSSTGQALTTSSTGQALTTSSPGQIPHLLGDVDVALPVLHGPFGEDGTIQGLLEMAGVPYVGAGVLSSAVSMDKEYMKIIFRAKGLPVGPHVVVRPRDWPPEVPDGTADAAALERKRVLDAITELGWPLFVKPARGGSSIGTSKASDLAELDAAIENARRYDPKVIVEAAIRGSEIECSVLEGLNGGPPDTSIPGQLLIDGGQEFWDFEAKYLDAASGMAIPAPIPAGHQQEIRRMAAQAFDAVSCEGLARVDFFYTPDGQILINEINTIPGLSPASYFQKMWEASGLAFPQLIDRLLQTALNKRPGLR